MDPQLNEIDIKDAVRINDSLNIAKNSVYFEMLEEKPFWSDADYN